MLLHESLTTIHCFDQINNFALDSGSGSGFRWINLCWIVNEQMIPVQSGSGPYSIVSHIMEACLHSVCIRTR